MGHNILSFGSHITSELMDIAVCVHSYLTGPLVDLVLLPWWGGTGAHSVISSSSLFILSGFSCFP
jgi:hypothetical protein